MYNVVRCYAWFCVCPPPALYHVKVENSCFSFFGHQFLVFALKRASIFSTYFNTKFYILFQTEYNILLYIHRTLTQCFHCCKWDNGGGGKEVLLYEALGVYMCCYRINGSYAFVLGFFFFSVTVI